MPAREVLRSLREMIGRAVFTLGPIQVSFGAEAPGEPREPRIKSPLPVDHVQYGRMAARRELERSQ